MHSNLLWIFLIFISKTSSFLSENQRSGICPIGSFQKNKSKNIVALILARGGSKGIPLKNLVQVNGLSLIGRALKISHNANVFTEIWVSTDSTKIAREAEYFGGKVHIRPKHLAEDETPSIDAVQEFMEKHANIESIALIQCTSVFISERYLQKAAELFRNRDVDCVFSVVRSWKLRWGFSSNSKTFEAINFNIKKRPRRQDWDGELVEAGMFYFSRRHLIQEEKAFQNERCKIVEIDAEDALEIDTVHHLKVARSLFQNN